MQNVSKAARYLVDNLAPVSLGIYIDGKKLDVGVGTGSYTGACAGDDEFSFGNACAAGMNIVIAAAYPHLKDHRIQIVWSVDGVEYPLLTGCVKNSKVSAGRTTIEAWDDMYFSGSSALVITEDVAVDCDAAVAFAAVASSMGVTAEPESLALLDGLTIPGGLSNAAELSNSAVAGHIAGLVGGNALMTRAGLLAIRQYTDIGWDAEPYSGGASAENEDFSVTGVTLQREETSSKTNDDGTAAEQKETKLYSAGNGSLILSNPLASQDAADRAFEVLRNLTIRPGSFTFPGGLLLEPGDIFTLHTMDGNYAVAVASITMNFDGGVKSTVDCGGASEDGGSVGSVNRALRELALDYAKLKKLCADNAEISSAHINRLLVNVLRAETIKLVPPVDEEGYIFGSWEELNAMLSQVATDMEMNTQKVIGATLDFEPFYSYGVITITVGPIYGIRTVAATLMSFRYHMFSIADEGDDGTLVWHSWSYANTSPTEPRVVLDYSHGDWHVRKWSNGQCELWATIEATADLLSWGNVCFAQDVIPAQAYPVTFINTPVVVATPQTTSEYVYGLLSGTVPGTGTTSPSFCVWRANAASASIPVRVDLYVKGTLG